MSKVLIPLPKFVIVKPDNEGGEEFVMKVAARANMLVGRYGWNEHQTCLAQILTARLNCVFEVGGIKYQAQSGARCPCQCQSFEEEEKREAIDKTEAASRRQISVKKETTRGSGQRENFCYREGASQAFEALKKILFRNSRAEPLA
jgi:chorismate mutase